MSLIIVIDDDPDILETTEIILKSENYEVITVDNPSEGFETVKKEKPDLIILDVMMEEPDDGFFLAQKFRREGITIPILMYTSISKAVGMEFGAGETVPVNEFVEKPISSEELLNKVRKLINMGE
jgi:DNA-binding response OmpR family regulator